MPPLFPPNIHTDPIKVQELDRCARAQSLVLLSSQYNSSMAGGFVFEITQFTADQNYKIVGGNMSSQITVAAAGSEAFAAIGWTFDFNSMDYTFDSGNLALLNASTFLSVSMGTHGAQGSSMQAANASINFSPYGIYLEKGQTIYLATSSTVNVDIGWSTNLYLSPLYS